MKGDQVKSFESSAALMPSAGELPLIDFTRSISNLSDLLSVALAFTGKSGLSKAELAIVRGKVPSKDAALLRAIRRDVLQGSDPLGSIYCQIKSAVARRPAGQTFTPAAVIETMLDWADRQSDSYARVVDPGAGSGRFTFRAMKRFSKAQAVAVERDPILALLLRAGAQIHGLGNRLKIVVGDFREIKLPVTHGRSLFLGNPPYVRHHDIAPKWKRWYSQKLEKLGHGNSQLAGLHLHFFLKVHELARKGDEGCFVTAAEWLDVNYGQALRDLLCNGLGGKSVYAIAPEISIFDDAMVSAAITCFSPGANRTHLSFKKIIQASELSALDGGREVAIETAQNESRWSPLFGSRKRLQSKDRVALGDLFRVSRGQVTGLNRVWIAGAETPPLPERFLIPCVTKATDILNAGDHVIRSLSQLRRVISLPATFEDLTERERNKIKVFLAWAEKEGAAKGYIATHRDPWWRVDLKPPAPIVVTYMGRRPPVFASNIAGARLINVAHEICPREPLTEDYLLALVPWLNKNVSVEQGRAYAGGLIKFEPSEIMRLRIPSPDVLLRENNNARISKPGKRMAS